MRKKKGGKGLAVLSGRALYEYKKDLFNIYENELHPKNVEEDTGIKDYTQFDGINDDWEEFNERDFAAKKGSA